MSDEGKASDAADGGMTVDNAERCVRCWGPYEIQDSTAAKVAVALLGEVRRLRESNHVTAENFGKAQLEIAQLQTQVARVEALSEKLREPHGRTQNGKPIGRHMTGEQVADEIDYALRVPHAPRVLEQLRAKLARVEALPPKWEAEHEASDTGLDAYDCAQALRITLRGEK